ncbi:MAG: hypothetical protein FJY56_03540 [Betaproteobacteria bacterium]|nr:hypothetical protein [Betaproteobacteria bacterium]
MESKAGFEIVHVKDIPWEDRRNVDNWPSRAGMYCDDKDNQLCIRLIDYPKGSTEPRHVHGGMHATTVLKHHTIVDGKTLRPLDVVLGPSNEPHGPLHYPESCQLLSAFQGSYFHSEVETLSTEKHNRLIQQEQIPWEAGANGEQIKTLVDRGCGRLLVQAIKFAPGGTMPAKSYSKMHSALIAFGGADIDGVALGEWDFLRVRDAAHGAVKFPQGATLLALTMR